MASVARRLCPVVPLVSLFAKCIVRQLVSKELLVVAALTIPLPGSPIVGILINFLLVTDIR